jgi:hypothetical protein
MKQLQLQGVVPGSVDVPAARGVSKSPCMLRKAAGIHI